MNIIDFIDSKTLRSHLEGKELSPAVECILISQSCNQPLLRKISALQERYNSFSESEFKREFIMCVLKIRHSEQF